MTCSASQSSSVAKLGLKPRYLWLEACAFSVVQLGGGDKGAYPEERVQGAFTVVVLVTLTRVSPGVGPSSGLPQPPLDLSPRTAVVASHAEEVVMVTGRASRGSGRGRGWRRGKLGAPGALAGVGCWCPRIRGAEHSGGRAGGACQRCSLPPLLLPSTHALFFLFPFLSAFSFTTFFFFLLL